MSNENAFSTLKAAGAEPTAISHWKDKNLHLSIEIRKNLMALCLLDKDTNKYVSFQKYNMQTEKSTEQFVERVTREEAFCEGVALGKIPASSVSVVFCENHSMLVPANFYKNEWTADYLDNQNLLKSGDAPYSDYLTALDSYNLYGINSQLATHLKAMLPAAEFRHHSSIFIEYLLILNKDSKDQEAHVCVFQNFLELVVLKSGKLILYNRFIYQTETDLTYFILWVYEQLKLDNGTTCVFYGDIDENAPAYLSIAKYVNHVKFGNSNSILKEQKESFPGSRLIADNPHLFNSLFMQYLCI